MTGALVSVSDAAWFSDRDTVQYEFAPEGQIIKQDFYLVVLRPLQDAV
jgi:hypothetical protein